MADNKDMTMQQQTSTIKQKQTQKFKLPPRHSHEASPANPNFSFPSSTIPASSPSSSSVLHSPHLPLPPLKRKTPDPPTSTSSPRLSKLHKKKLLKVILKVPHSSPSPSPPPSPPSSSPLSRPSPRSPSHFHSHNHHLSASASPSPSPSPAPSPPPPSPPPPHTHLQQRQKLTAQLQDPHQRPLKPPHHPALLPHIKNSPLEPKHHLQHLHKKSPQLRQIHQLEHHSKRQPLGNPSGQQNQAQSAHDSSRSKQEHPNSEEDQAKPSRIKTEKEDQRHAKRIEQGHQASHSKRPGLEIQATPSQNTWPGQDDLKNLCRSRCTKQDQANPYGVKITEQGNQVNFNCDKRPEARQLDEEAIQSRPLEEQNSGPYPKRVKTSLQNESAKINHYRPPISSQEISSKKLRQSSAQGPPHGLHHSPKIPSFPVHLPCHNPLPAVPSPTLQSTALSLSPSVTSDEAQKPSKKRKLRSLFETEATGGHVVGNNISKDEHGDKVPSSVSPVRAHPENIKCQDDAATARFSPNVAAAASETPHFVPAKKLLKGILDRLQKKDKFGVFAEPVDPKEVPNYYDIIKEPMDFGTMRKRIISGHYTSLDLFKKDIFLICNNAMKYNGKGTVYFRHARAIKKVAERILEDLKVSGLTMEVDEPSSKQKNGGLSRVAEKHDFCANAGSPSETRVDLQEDFSGYLFKTMGVGDGRRFQAFDENRRNTYMGVNSSSSGNDSLLTTISGDSLHFVPTGHQMDFIYAKSLARFAADLGPLVWKIAAEKIKRALPPGFPFGPGWVGEREAPGGITLTPSAKQQSMAQSTVQPTAKSVNENRAPLIMGNPQSNQVKLDNHSHVPIGNVISTTGKYPSNQAKLDNHSLVPPGNAVTGKSLSNQVKLDHQTHMQAGNPQLNQENAANHERSSGIQCHVPPIGKPANEIRSPVIFGNSLLHQNGSDQLLQVQPAAQSMAASLHNSKPSTQGNASVNLEQSRGIVGNKIKLGTPVNLNHPLVFQPEDGVITDEGLSNMDNATQCKEDKFLDRQRVSDVNSPGALSGMGSSATAPLATMFEGSHTKGVTCVLRAPLIERINTVKDTAREVVHNSTVGINATTWGDHFDRRATTPLASAQPSRVNLLNGSVSGEASSISRNGGKNNVFNQYDNLQSTSGLMLPHNLNMPADTQEIKLVDSVRPNSSPSTKRLAFPRNLNMPIQQLPIQPTSTSEVSPIEPAVSKQTSGPSLDRAGSERFREHTDAREMEMLDSFNRMPISMASVMPKKVFAERGFDRQLMESRNGPLPPEHELVHGKSLDLNQIHLKQNTTAAIPSSCFPAAVPASNSVPRGREELKLPGWVPTQQLDSSTCVGRGGAKMQKQTSRISPENQESPGNHTKPQTMMRLASMQLADGQVYGYGNQKHVPNLPHFLQPQFSSDPHLPGHHQQMQLNSQSNPGTPNNSSSESRDLKFVRHFQIPGHSAAGYPQAGGPPMWSYMAPHMKSQGSHQPFTVAPDLNVSLPLPPTKSFDQANGNEIQQPDLALQL